LRYPYQDSKQFNRELISTIRVQELAQQMVWRFDQESKVLK